MIDNGAVTESLREQVMVAQFQGATGCTREQARQLLQGARWEFQTALSMFFQECAVPQQPSSNPTAPVAMVTSGPGQSIFVHQQCRNSATGSHLGPVCAPCNTPATPPNFPEALLALQKLQAGGTDWSASPPSWQQQQQTPKILASFNLMPPPSDRYFQSCDWPTTTTTPPLADHFPKDPSSPDSSSISVQDPHLGSQFYANSHLSSENNGPMSTNRSPSSNAMFIGAFQ